MRKNLSAIFVLYLLSTSCGSNSITPSQGPAPAPSPTALATPSAGPGTTKTVTSGTWGGSGVHLEVVDGISTIEFDCAHGLLRQPLQLDSSNRFSSLGTFTPETGVVRTDVPPNNLPAIYAGEVFGDQMNLSVSYTPADRLLQPPVTQTFRLYYRASLRLNKCL